LQSINFGSEKKLKKNFYNTGRKVNTLSYKTVSANKSTVEKEWLLVDATDEILGRLSSKVAKILRGKNKPSFTPHVDCGDNVIIINAEKIKLTGNKPIDKEYIRHTGYPGGQRIVGFEKQMAKDPTFIIETAVKGMLPKNRLSKRIYGNLYVYAGSEHPHAAQEPKQINLNTIK
jgi:large subunit ribosomal protein L13